jgi:uncharacterized membrane protein YidH (DUF202 family)
MIVFDFIYFCIYALVPNKAILGKRDVACTFFSSYTTLFLLGLFGMCIRVFNLSSNLLLIGIIIVGSGLFVLTRVIYLKQVKLRSMHRRFRKIPKWFLKTIGIIYILFCFVCLVYCAILISLI